MGHGERSFFQDAPSRKSAAPGQDKPARSPLDEGSLPADASGIIHAVTVIEHELRSFRQAGACRETGSCSAVAQLQNAFSHFRPSGKAVPSGQDQGASSGLDQPALSGHDAGQHGIRGGRTAVRRLDGQCRSGGQGKIVQHSGQAAVNPQGGIPQDLNGAVGITQGGIPGNGQYSSCHFRSPGVVVVCRQHQGPAVQADSPGQRIVQCATPFQESQPSLSYIAVTGEMMAVADDERG